MEPPLCKAVRQSPNSACELRWLIGVHANHCKHCVSANIYMIKRCGKQSSRTHVLGHVAGGIMGEGAGDDTARVLVGDQVGARRIAEGLGRDGAGVEHPGQPVPDPVIGEVEIAPSIAPVARPPHSAD